MSCLNIGERSPLKPEFSNLVALLMVPNFKISAQYTKIARLVKKDSDMPREY